MRSLLLEEPIFGGAYLSFKIDWASLIVGSKFTVFAWFYFVFEGKFPSTSPRRAYIKRRFFCVTGLGGLYLEGLLNGWAYFRNFTVVNGCEKVDKTLVL